MWELYRFFNRDVEYANRVPREIFTKDVAKSYLTSWILYQLSKYFEGTVAAVYFVIELPDAWVQLTSTRFLGLVNASAFNKISLGNGYTAYL
jgi:hypothetical protein